MKAWRRAIGFINQLRRLLLQGSVFIWVQGIGYIDPWNDRI